MNFTTTPFKSAAPQNYNSLLSSSLYNSSSLLNQEHSGSSSSLSTPETTIPSPLLDTFGLSQDPFLDTTQNDPNQSQPLVGSSSWNRLGGQPLQPLMRNQSGYMHSSDQIQSLLQDNERLRQENLMLAVGKAAIEEALQKLVCKLNSHEPATSQAPLVDHSKLRFFTSTQFNTWLKCADANMKERGQLPFLEDVNGQPLSREKKAAICQSMRELWQGFKIKNQAPLKWKKGDPALQELFRKEMVAKHPELGLCMDNWKIDYIATERYPSWASTHLKDQRAAVKPKVIKPEPSSVDSHDDENKPVLSDENAPALSDEKPVKKRPLTLCSTSSGEDSSEELADSLLLSKRPKLDDAKLETPIFTTPSSPKIATESNQLQESPHDSATTPTFPAIKNPLDVLNSRSIFRPLPRMIPSAMTTCPTDTSPSAPSPTECKPGPSTNTPPTISASDNAAPSPTPSASTTNAKRMRPGPNKNGRTLCAHRWLHGVAKDGTTADFKIYWTGLPKDTKKQYELEAAQLVASGVWHANTADVIVKISNGTVY